MIAFNSKSGKNSTVAPFLHLFTYFYIEPGIRILEFPLRKKVFKPPHFFSFSLLWKSLTYDRGYRYEHGPNEEKKRIFFDSVVVVYFESLHLCLQNTCTGTQMTTGLPLSLGSPSSEVTEMSCQNCNLRLWDWECSSLKAVLIFKLCTGIAQC
jgi:hypothetical protein